MVDLSPRKDTNEKDPKFYTINNERFFNPAVLHKKVSSKVIDNWPAHSSGRLHPHSQILVTNNHNIKVLNESESKLPNLVPKPKFLEFLENHVMKELIRNKVTDIKPDCLRLQIHCEVFEWLIQALKSYRPLLASIKREYEMNIDYLRSELRKVEPMKELLWTLSYEYDHRIMAIRKKESKEIIELKHEKSKLNIEVSNLKSEMETVKCKVKRLMEELEYQNLLCRNESDAKKILISDMNDLRSKLKEMERLAKAPENEDQKEDPVKLRMAYDQAKLAIIEGNQKIMTLEATYADVVPKTQYEALYMTNEKNMTDLTNIKEENEILSNAYSTIQNQYNAIYVQRDHLYMQLKSARQKLLSTSPISKAERSILERNDLKLQQVKDNLEEETNKWMKLASEITHDELVKRIQEELSKTDGSAEIAVEVFMNPALQDFLGQSGIVPQDSLMSSKRQAPS